MADFKTHVTFSSVLGCGYAVAGKLAGMELETALVAGGLCGVSGMLPDVDSDSGVPRREAMGFAAAIVPMLLLDRFDQMNLSRDQIILIAAGIYFLIRFKLAKLIGKFSVHRGMWHSIPAVLIFAGLAFLIAGPADNLSIRYFKAFAVGLGALSHLVLDEVYSVDTRGVVPKFKKSFGTAVKFWGKDAWANFSTYSKLAVVTGCILAEPNVFARLEQTSPRLADGVQSAQAKLHGIGDRVQRQWNGGAAAPPAAEAVSGAGFENVAVTPATAAGGWGHPPQSQPPSQQQWRGFSPASGQAAYGQAAQQATAYNAAGWPTHTTAPVHQTPPRPSSQGFRPNNGMAAPHAQGWESAGWESTSGAFAPSQQGGFMPR